jgi:hypothetical protein
MDDRQFDDMTRTVGMQTDRRGLLKAAAGGVLGLVGLSALADRVWPRNATRTKTVRRASSVTTRSASNARTTEIAAAAQFARRTSASKHARTIMIATETSSA